MVTRQRCGRGEQLQADGAGELQLHLLQVEHQRVQEPPQVLHLLRPRHERPFLVPTTPAFASPSPPSDIALEKVYDREGTERETDREADAVPMDSGRLIWELALAPVKYVGRRRVGG